MPAIYDENGNVIGGSIADTRQADNERFRANSALNSAAFDLRRAAIGGSGRGSPGAALRTIAARRGADAALARIEGIDARRQQAALAEGQNATQRVIAGARNQTAYNVADRQEQGALGRAQLAADTSRAVEKIRGRYGLRQEDIRGSNAARVAGITGGYGLEGTRINAAGLLDRQRLVNEGALNLAEFNASTPEAVSRAGLNTAQAGYYGERAGLERGQTAAAREKAFLDALAPNQFTGQSNLPAGVQAIAAATDFAKQGLEPPPPTTAELRDRLANQQGDERSRAVAEGRPVPLPYGSVPSAPVQALPPPPPAPAPEPSPYWQNLRAGLGDVRDGITGFFAVPTDQDQEQGYSMGGLVEGYADGGAIVPFGGTPQAQSLDPVMREYGQYIASAAQHNIRPVPLGQFINLLDKGRKALARAPAMNSVETYAGGGAIPVQGKQVMDQTGTPDMSGSDTIPAVIDGHRPAALTSGEYVIPAEVVKIKGTEFFDKLVQKYMNPESEVA